MAVWRLQVNTGGANVADYCLQNHVAALWAGKVLAYLMGNYETRKPPTKNSLIGPMNTSLKPANTLIKRL